MAIVMIITLSTRNHGSSSSDHQGQKYTSIGAGVSASGDLPQGIAAKASTVPAQQFASLTDQVTSTVEITPTGKLPHQITLRFTMNPPAQKSATVFIASSETQDGKPTLLAPTVSDDGQYAYIQTDHLSWWSTFVLSIPKVTDAMKTVVKGMQSAFLGNLTDKVDPPACDHDYFGSDKPNDDFDIKSSNKSTVYWCFGLENGKHVLKVVNRELYPLNITHAGFTVLSDGKITPELVQLSRIGSGGNTILLAHDEADFAVDSIQQGQTIQINTSYSGWADALNRFQVAIETLTTIMGQFGVEQIPENTLKVYELIDKMLSYSGCVSAVESMDIGQMMVACQVGKVLGAALKISGGVVLSAFVALISMIGNLSSWFASQFTVLISQFNGADKYSVWVSRAKDQLSKFTGDWAKHELRLNIADNGSGSILFRNYSCPYPPDSSGNMIMCFIQMKVHVVSSPGGAAAQVDSIESQHGTVVNQSSLQPMSFPPGLSFALTQVSTNVFTINMGNDASYGDQGTVTVCRVGSPEYQQAVCG